MNEVFLCSKIAMVSDEKRLVYGVVLVPDEVDSQGDVAPAEVIEDAAHDYLASSRALSRMHLEPAVASVVESYIAPHDVSLGNVPVKKGSWVIAVKVGDPDLWEGVRSGVYGGFSVGGLAERSAAAELHLSKAQGTPPDAASQSPAGEKATQPDNVPSDIQEDEHAELHKAAESDGSSDCG